jgi:hypothetical protein
MNETTALSSNGALARVEGLGTSTILTVLIAQLNRRHPGLAQDIEKDLQNILPTLLGNGPAAADAKAILEKGFATILSSALNDPSTSEQKNAVEASS